MSQDLPFQPDDGSNVLFRHAPRRVVVPVEPETRRRGAPARGIEVSPRLAINVAATGADVAIEHYGTSISLWRTYSLVRGVAFRTGPETGSLWDAAVANRSTVPHKRGGEQSNVCMVKRASRSGHSSARCRI